MPTTILRAIAKLLLTDTSDTVLLSTMHQRYPDVVSTAIEELVSEGEGNRAEFESLLMSLVIVSHDLIALTSLLTIALSQQALLEHRKMCYWQHLMLMRRSAQERSGKLYSSTKTMQSR